jgi:S-methylmethionine-dependent homocysteine/selenocysteine methylase
MKLVLPAVNEVDAVCTALDPMKTEDWSGLTVEEQV